MSYNKYGPTEKVFFLQGSHLKNAYAFLIKLFICFIVHYKIAIYLIVTLPFFVELPLPNLPLHSHFNPYPSHHPLQIPHTPSIYLAHILIHPIIQNR